MEDINFSSIELDEVGDSILDLFKHDSVDEIWAAIEMVSLITCEFWVGHSKLDSLEGDVYVEDTEWVTLADTTARDALSTVFGAPTEEMVKHFKPLYVKAYINDKAFSRVLVDNGVVLNVMSLLSLKSLSKIREDLISTNMTMASFIGEASEALGILVAEITVAMIAEASQVGDYDREPTLAVDDIELPMELESRIRRVMPSFESQDPLKDINLGTEEVHRLTHISGLLNEEDKQSITTLLLQYKDYFA
ncbi:hypothetical protein K7X08_001013 [Anisodus acutangulus]|uniref:Uncharacterized protein n=1 Tax=Anisodus acutangulus TaxID=402998 RepID=A0A9Q1MR58_9SOLA|nr:hypothetical protein K7X08_001013 [Anisodus acutangulus]